MRRPGPSEDPICHRQGRVATYKDDDNIISLTRVWDAYSGDVIMYYAFRFCYENLRSEDFVETFPDAFLALGEFGGLGCQFPIMGPGMEMMPDFLSRAMNPVLGRVLTLLNDLSNEVDNVKAEVKQGKKPNRPIIFHEMLTHDLPPEEFAKRRMRDEAQTVVGAGLTATAWSLSNACFYIIENRVVQGKLRKELLEAIPDLNAPDAFNYRKLEGLPYLTGCVKEGIRLGTGVSGRNHRIWKSRLPYRDWIIPAGTTVSMNHQNTLRSEDVFPNPNEIVPERWAGSAKAPDGNSLGRYFVPFGKGDRQCWGINLAFMDIYLGIAHIFRHFRLELYETDRTGVVMFHEFFLPAPVLTSKGVRAKITKVFN